MTKRYTMSLWKYDKNRKPRYFCNLSRYSTNSYEDILKTRQILEDTIGDVFEIRVHDAIS